MNSGAKNTPHPVVVKSSTTIRLHSQRLFWRFSSSLIIHHEERRRRSKVNISALYFAITHQLSCKVAKKVTDKCWWCRFICYFYQTKKGFKLRSYLEKALKNVGNIFVVWLTKQYKIFVNLLTRVELFFNIFIFMGGASIHLAKMQACTQHEFMRKSPGEKFTALFLESILFSVIAQWSNTIFITHTH